LHETALTIDETALFAIHKQSKVVKCLTTLLEVMSIGMHLAIEKTTKPVSKDVGSLMQDNVSDMQGLLNDNCDQEPIVEPVN